MADFVRVDPSGNLELSGKHFTLNCAVYFGRYPGLCGSRWLSDPDWAENQKLLDSDFACMETLGLNSIGLFIRAEDVLDNGRLESSGVERLDEVVHTGWRHGIRTILFPAFYINGPQIYRSLTGREAPTDIEFWHAAHSPAVFDAMVHITSTVADRYKDMPGVMGYLDRIDRLVGGFGRRDKAPGLERIWRDWLESRYTTFAAFRESHPNLPEDPRSFAEVKLPQDFPDGFSLRDSRAYEYALMQRAMVGEAQGRFDAEIKKVAPNQIVWTPFEGVSLTNPILDGYIHTPKVLEAIWAEYYPGTGFSNACRVHLPRVDADYLLIEDFDVAHLPAYSAQAYLFARWLKSTAQCPVILCQGVQMEAERTESPWEYHYQSLIDRTNRAILQAGADGWAYWCWMDDATSLTAFASEAATQRHKYLPHGETMGLMRWDGSLRPAAITARDYSRMIEGRTVEEPRAAQDVLLLMPEPKMVIEQGILTLQTATGIAATLMRCGTLPEARWTATSRAVINSEDLNKHKLIVLGDSTYTRDHQEVPALLADYVRNGGVLLWPVHDTGRLEDEFGLVNPAPALRELSGCSGDPAGTRAIGQIQWFIRDGFEHISSQTYGRHRCHIEGDSFTWLSPDAEGLDVIACAKFVEGPASYDAKKDWAYEASMILPSDPGGAIAPLLYRFPLGKGLVYVFTWTFNVFRDDATRMLYGGSEWDWVLRLPLESAGIVPDLTVGLGTELRDAAWQRPSRIRAMY